MRYRSLGVCSLARWSARIQSSFHEQRPTQVPIVPCPVSPTGLSPAVVAVSKAFSYRTGITVDWSYNPERSTSRFGLIRVRSPLLTESMSLSLPLGTEMFQFPRFPPTCVGPHLAVGGFPHSEIPESTPLSGSSGLIAGKRVLHRLQCQGIHRGPLLS